MDTAGEHVEKLAPQKTPPTVNANRRLSSSGKKLNSSQSPKSSAGKRVQLSAAKRLQYTSSPSKNVGANMSLDSKLPQSQARRQLELTPQAATTSTQRLPICSPHQAVNGVSDGDEACDSSDFSQCETSKLGHLPAEVTTRSPKVTDRSAGVISRSSLTSSRSPRSSLKRSSSLLSPAGQPKTKKFIVERLRNAKTSRKKPVDVAASSKFSPGRKSTNMKDVGKCTVFMFVMSSLSSSWWKLLVTVWQRNCIITTASTALF